MSVNAGALIVDAPPDLPVAVWDALTLHKATLVDLLTPTATYADLARHEEREAIQRGIDELNGVMYMGPVDDAKAAATLQAFLDRST